MKDLRSIWNRWLGELENLDQREVSPISKHIFQTHKSERYIQTHPDLREATTTWKKHNAFQYHFYNDQQCETFMNRYFSGNVYQAYQKAPLTVMKADLWRYCILYQYGGIYADADTICKMNPEEFLVESREDNRKPYLVVAPERGSNYFCQWVFAAPPKSPIIKSIIDTCVERINAIDDILKRETRKHVVYTTTGPRAFTDGIKAYIQQHGLRDHSKNTDYVTDPIPEMKVFEPRTFHKEKVTHLFAGIKGWKKEAKELFDDSR